MGANPTTELEVDDAEAFLTPGQQLRLEELNRLFPVAKTELKRWKKERMVLRDLLAEADAKISAKEKEV